MKKVALILSVIILAGCGGNKEVPKETSKSNEGIQQEQKVEVQSEFPPETNCKADLGTLKMNVNGESQGKRTEMTELKKFIFSDTCDNIEIHYELKGSYGDNIGKKIVYSKRRRMLQDISTKYNVKEEYKNISVQALKAFFKKKEKSFYSLEEYGGKYDFNNREMTNNAVGPKPEQSDFDGSVKIVEEYIKSNAKDKNSIKYLEWSKVIPSDEFWVVRCKYEGNNSFGAKTTENTWFYIKNSKVVKMK